MVSKKLNILLNTVTDYLKNELNKIYTEENTLSNEFPQLNLDLITCTTYNKLKDNILKIYNSDFKNLNLNIRDQITLINKIFSKLFTLAYKFNKNLNWDDNYIYLSTPRSKGDSIKIPENYIKLEKQFNKLQKLPQPIQRSIEWFNYRFHRITASDTAAAINMNPYEPLESFILKKCDPDHPFMDNATVFHGRKYEPLATLLYEHIYNVKVAEFGVLPSEKYPFLGASPDGICSKYTLDNKFSSKLGVMLEIKCPVTRNIIINGNIIGDICPYYYYCQIQQQLICCDLDICDFWQCKFTEYKSKHDYLADDCQKCIITESINDSLATENQQMFLSSTPSKLSVNKNLLKGIIIEFYPKNYKSEFEGSNIEWKSKYIIPKRLNMDEIKYNDFLLKMFDEYKILYPEIYKDYYFNKIIYWKLEKAHNVSIPKNDIFLNNIIPRLQTIWNTITYYREHQDKLTQLKNITKQKAKYYKVNIEFNIHNNFIINN